MRFFKVRRELTYEQVITELEEVAVAEANLWKMVSSRHTRAEIPKVMKNMQGQVRLIGKHLGNIEKVKGSNELFGKLEEHLSNQIRLLKGIDSLSVQEVEEILNFDKGDADISKTSQLIRQGLKMCQTLVTEVREVEGKVEKLGPESSFVASTKETFAQLLNSFESKWQGSPSDLLRARIMNPELFKNWFWINAAVIYHSDYDNNGLFKLVLDPRRNKLIQELRGKANDRRVFIEGSQEEYDSLQVDSKTVFEFDRTKAKYNSSLTKNEVLSHPFWLALIQNDKKLLGDYFDNWSQLCSHSKGLGVYLRSKVTTVEWVSVIVNVGADSSGFNCLHNLNYIFGRFLLKNPSQ